MPKFSPRHQKIAALVGTFVLGIISTLVSGYVQDYFRSIKPTEPTRVYYYLPRLNHRDISSLPQASCWSSATSNRPDALRCADDESAILDPCFMGPEKTWAGCPINPRDDTKAEFYRITPPSQTPGQTTPMVPWAVTTIDGSACGLMTGTTDLLDGHPLVYGCGGGGTLSLGAVTSEEKIGEYWSVLKFDCVRASNPRKIQSCVAKEAWY